MQLVLYKNTSPDNTINKVLVDSVILNINFKGDVDIINPKIPLLRLVGLDYREYNYAQIVELGRFYFIDSIESNNAKIDTLTLKTDVLETYKDDILASNAKFRKVIAAGDYGETSLSLTGEVAITNHISDVALEPADNSLLSILRWK